MLEFLTLLLAQPVQDGKLSTVSDKIESSVSGKNAAPLSVMQSSQSNTRPAPILDSSEPDSSLFKVPTTTATTTAPIQPSSQPQGQGDEHLVQVDSSKGFQSFMADSRGIIANAPSREAVMCRLNEKGPALVVQAVGLKDRKGLLRIDLYPPTEDDFMADEEDLAAAHKIFRRQEKIIPQEGLVKICVRVPKAGTYAISLTHDRDANHRVTVSEDGVGVPTNPPHLLHEPRLNESLVNVGPGVTIIPVRFSYRRGLLSFAPLRKKDTIDYKASVDYKTPPDKDPKNVSYKKMSQPEG
ncbi:MAG: DUF2141 domain-containing protein [Zymomonas mobilis subsp. pomaceae]|uniref:Uncharacterized protein n=1 Tax=Zymomonas mobilis subsp. pomaceae (strain ATCC 29192 / DSM 22645 / JCM 10191 / CCUG 17912 / NBRC 13757 / NCIMB 11200 / NRRL B-4491 / Barker I) TaxID=579138 RepID=F8ETC5_ZYMMT|nr:DUF2141 domain-containing protein [Zymomonas mobilis]AEI37950.1 Protein of unknown function DUF2141 [Zymomonas mobilis subsp. pomaceae ATCC 29192]MDX5949318.1 DUF2141 domain-containing protein [Zymomonas mobilis subsp. pomaceae]GEB89675.1 hypothetical protein ZMO02_13120 [Zymomonas mobilis subsp. pomaceae]